MRGVLIIIAFIGLLMISTNSRMFSTNDDDSYFAVATSIAYGDFPSFANEYHWGQKVPHHSVGPGILASPFVFLFSTVDRIKGAPIVEKRTEENRYWTWTLLGFHVASYFYLILGTWLLLKYLSLWVDYQSATLSCLFSVISGGGILIYSFNRPVMAHTFEFFTVCMCLFLLSIRLKGMNIRYFEYLFGAACGFIFLVRYNNAPLAFCLLTILLALEYRGSIYTSVKSALKMALPILSLVFVFRVLPILANGYDKRDQLYVGAGSRLIPNENLLFYLERLKEIFFGADMGLIYTGPAIILGLLCLPIFRRQLPNRIILPIFVVSLTNLYIAISWKSFASYYGYRYFVFTLMPILALPLAFGVRTLKEKAGKHIVYICLLAVSYIPLQSMLVFGRSPDFSLRLMKNNWDELTFTQPTYHLDLIRHLKSDPLFGINLGFKSGFFSYFSQNSDLSLKRLLLYFLPPLFFVALQLFIKRRLRHRHTQKLASTE